MEGEVRSWELVEHLFDASVSPERLDELIGIWDAQIAGVDPKGAVRLGGFAGSVFARQIGGVMQILEQLRAAELARANDLLSTILGAAMVLDDDGEVLAANDAAAAVFGLRPGGSIRGMPLEAPGLDELTSRVAHVAAEGTGGDEIVQLRPAGFDRLLLVHLKAMPGARRRVLAVTSELAWPEAVSEFLARMFALTAAEVEVMRRLVAGETVAGIAAATGRRAGTVRSQLHAILQKTATRSQAEVARLGLLLMQSVPAEAEPKRPVRSVEQHQRFLRMPDGRQIEVLSFGDPAGRPVIWMQSTYGFWRLPRVAEAGLCPPRAQGADTVPRRLVRKRSASKGPQHLRGRRRRHAGADAAAPHRLRRGGRARR